MSTPSPTYPASGEVEGHPHRWLVRSLIGLATLLGIVAIFAVWANRQLLDTKYWASTNTKLIESPPIREEVASYLTEQLYANVDVAGELKNELPSELKPLAAPAAGALKDVVEKGINLLLERPRVQQLWSKANQVTHAEFVRLVENKGTVVKLPGGGAVVLDLRPMLTEVAEKVGAPTSLVNKIPPKVAQLRIVTSKQLNTMQNAVNLLRSLALVLPLLVVAMFALAVYLARGRRRQTLIAVGFAFIAAGLVVVVVRGIVGNKVVDSLATTEAVKPAAEAAWSIGTSVLSDIAWSTVIIGIPVILAGVLAGPTQSATTLRRLMAPYLQRPARHHVRRVWGCCCSCCSRGDRSWRRKRSQGSRSSSCWRYSAPRCSGARRPESSPTRTSRMVPLRRRRPKPPIGAANHTAAAGAIRSGRALYP